MAATPFSMSMQWKTTGPGLPEQDLSASKTYSGTLPIMVNEDIPQSATTVVQVGNIDVSALIVEPR